MHHFTTERDWKTEQLNINNNALCKKCGHTQIHTRPTCLPFMHVLQIICLPVSLKVAVPRKVHATTFSKTN